MSQYFRICLTTVSSTLKLNNCGVDLVINQNMLYKYFLIPGWGRSMSNAFTNWILDGFFFLDDKNWSTKKLNNISWALPYNNPIKQICIDKMIWFLSCLRTNRARVGRWFWIEMNEVSHGLIFAEVTWVMDTWRLIKWHWWIVYMFDIFSNKKVFKRMSSGTCRVTPVMGPS